MTDLGMPHVDGRQVAAAIKAMSPSTPVIMLTGWGQRLVAEGDIDGGRAQVAHASQTLQHAAAGREAAAAWREAGDVLSQVGEPVAAMDAYQRALGLLGVTAAPTPASLRSIAEA